MPNIKFPPFVQQRPLNILLNDESLDLFTFLPLRLIQNAVNFIYLIEDGNSISSIAILAWLYNPDIPTASP